MHADDRQDEGTVSHLVKRHAADLAVDQRQKVIPMPLGAQVDDGIREEAVVREQLRREAQVVGERRLKHHEALDGIRLQIGQRYRPILDGVQKPSSVQLCRIM